MTSGNTLQKKKKIFLAIHIAENRLKNTYLLIHLYDLWHNAPYFTLSKVSW